MDDGNYYAKISTYQASFFRVQSMSRLMLQSFIQSNNLVHSMDLGPLQNDALQMKNVIVEIFA